MAEDNRFWNLMAKTKLLQELDGQKWIKKNHQCSVRLFVCSFVRAWEARSILS
jgi:hypothetical protein